MWVIILTGRSVLPGYHFLFLNVQRKEFIMPSIEQKKGLNKKDIYLIFGALIIFGFGYVVPPFGGIQPMGMRMLGLVIGLIFMTCVGCNIFVSSMIALISIPIHGYKTVTELLATWTGSATTFQLVFAGALCLGLKETGAMDVLAKKMLGAKITKGRPAVLLLMILIVAFIVSVFMGGAPFFLLFFGLIDSIVEVAGYDKDDKFIRYALLGVYIGQYGLFLIPFKGAVTATIGFFNSTLGTYGLTFDTNIYMLFQIIVFVGFDVLYILALKFIFKPDLSKLAHVDVTKVEQFAKVPDQFDKRMKIAGCSAIFCILYILLTSFGAKWPGFKVWGALSNSFIWAVPLVLFSVVRVDGKPVWDIGKLAMNSSLWGMIALVGSMTLLGTICTDSAENMGIRGAITSLFGPIFGNMSIAMLCLVLVIFTVVITQVVHGQVLTMGLTPIVTAVVISRMQAGEAANPSIILTTISMCAQVAFLFPSGSVNAAYLLNRKEINSKFLFTSGVIVLCIYMIWQYICTMAFNVLFPVTL